MQHRKSSAEIGGRVLLPLLLLIALLAPIAQARPQKALTKPPPLTNDALLTQAQQKAFDFFLQKTDPNTGLTNDRAHNIGPDDTYTVASVSSTGYMLAALPLMVEAKYISSQFASARALTALNFLQNKMDHPHGWYYHFVDKTTGKRVWNSELSSIDTGLLVAGALVCGQYFHNTAVQTSANALYDAIDWNWMRTNGGTQPNKLLLSHGWTPENGWLPYNWDNYNELMTLVLLGLGAKNNPLPTASWTAWTRKPVTYKGMTTLSGGPIFLFEMAQNYYDFSQQKDTLGYDYSDVAAQGININRQYCLDKAATRRTYGPNIWGLNASDCPTGYSAFGAPNGPEDGTVSPTGVLAALPFTFPNAIGAAQAMYNNYGDRIWGRYGFSDAFNVDANWYDTDVIGIDLGMATLAIANYRSGSIWRLLQTHPSTSLAFSRAGFISATTKKKVYGTPQTKM